jgi:tRNA(Ile)-lysidine synthase TilS/MesJ
MLYMPEAQIKGAVKRLQLPVCKPICPFDGNTERERMKDMIKQLRKRFDRGDEMLFRALRKTEAYHLWDRYKS